MKQRLPSIATRLSRALLGWSLICAVAVSGMVWIGVREEVVELLDDTLRASAEALVGPLAQSLRSGASADTSAPVPADKNGARSMLPPPSGRFAWQVVRHGADGVAQQLLASEGAPAQPLRATPTAGFSDSARWRVFGAPMGQGGQILYVAQTMDERREAQLEVALSGALATLAVALLAHLWLRARLRHELAPLQALADRLARHEPLDAGSTLGDADRDELQPVHQAIDTLARRLRQRIDRERAFTGHAAHALRTPLAGIDAQLAVALREAPAALQPRLQRVRSAAGRLQRVVTAVLAMFRSGVEPARVAIDLAALVARLPVPGLLIEVEATQPVQADPDLVTAALLNLFDNALRHGASALSMSTPGPDVLLLHDDGPGVAADRRAALQAALDAPGDAGADGSIVGLGLGLGLGLQLAALVARAHGGRIDLPAVTQGFAVRISLRGEPGPAAPPRPA